MINEPRKQDDDGIFDYDVEEATKVIYENISDELLSKFDYDDIYLIMNLKEEYFDLIGINVKEGEKPPICDYPVDLDEPAMRYYIIKSAVQHELFIMDEELIDILEAELIYYEINGALGDMGEHLN